MQISLQRAIAHEYKLASDYYEDNFRDDDDDAYDYFDGKLPGLVDPDIDEAFQQIVSKDVADSIEHTLADIMPAFASESPVTFIPSGMEDEAQSEIETQLVNDIFIQQLNGFMQLTTACKDALLRKLGVIEVQTLEKVSVAYTSLENIPIPVLASLLSAEKNTPDTKIEVVETEEGDNGILTKAILRKTTKERQLYVESFPPDELLFNSDYEDTDLDNARFVCRHRIMTASQLVELGYNKEIIADLPPYSNTLTVEQPHNRNILNVDATKDAIHPSLKQIHVAFAYFNIDLDEDGIAERYRVVMAGNLESAPVILEHHPWETQPFCIGIPFVRPHKVHGISLFEKIKQVQDVKTKLMRQLLTAGERSIRGRIGVVGTGANLDDLRETLFGGIVRLTRADGIVPLPMDPYPREVGELLGLMDKQRKEGGGSAVDKANEQVLIGGDTAHGLERIMSAMEQLNSLVAKTLAETLLRQVYVKLHDNLRRYFNQPMQTKMAGNWVTAVPTSWPKRVHVAAALGLTMGDRLRQAQNYSTLVQEQQALLDKGSILVTEKSIYTLMIARANALMIPNASAFYVDPASPQGQQAAQARQQQQQQAKQEDMQVKLMNLQLLPKVEEIRANATLQVQMMRKEVEDLKINSNNIKDLNDLTVKLRGLEVQLIELNAKYDHEPVPDKLQS